MIELYLVVAIFLGAIALVLFLFFGALAIACDISFGDGKEEAAIARRFVVWGVPGAVMWPMALIPVLAWGSFRFISILREL
jgi:hypothetical protein